MYIDKYVLLRRFPYSRFPHFSLTQSFFCTPHTACTSLSSRIRSLQLNRHHCQSNLQTALGDRRPTPAYPTSPVPFVKTLPANDRGNNPIAHLLTPIFPMYYYYSTEYCETCCAYVRVTVCEECYSYSRRYGRYYQPRCRRRSCFYHRSSSSHRSRTRYYYFN
jgi:hypothetical protein